MSGTPCAKCGTILHTGEGRVTVSFQAAELIELASALRMGLMATPIQRKLRERLLCAASLIDEQAVIAARLELEY